MEQVWHDMYEAAKRVLRPRQISEYVSAGEVSAAILSGAGHIYTGVCIDTASTLGICAERNAIFNMITHGETDIAKVLCLFQDGQGIRDGGAPCGACRELMPHGRYKNIEIMKDFASGTIVRLGDLTPDWWIP